MRIEKKLKGAVSVAASLSLLAAMALPGCSSSESVDEDAIAATIDGEPVYEADVTTYIQVIRYNYDLLDEDDWASYLETYGETPAEIRESFIEYQAQEVLVAKAAEEAGVTVSSDDVDSLMETMKSYYEDDEWEEFLDELGVTEQNLWDNVYQSYIDEAVIDEMLEVTPTDEEIQEAIDENIADYNGAKRSSHILFDSDDEETAEEVLQELKDGADFEEMAETYSTDSSGSDGGDVGWDCENTFVDEYQDALDELGEGEMTQELVESDYGYHIILCTDVFSYEEGDTVTADDVPEDIYETIYSDLVSDLEDDAYSEYAAGLFDAAELVVNDMPDGLPYDVDVDVEDEEATEETTDSGEDADDASSDEEESNGDGDGSDGESDDESEGEE